MQTRDAYDFSLPADIWLPVVTEKKTLFYPAGQLIYQQDTRAEFFYYLKFGRVKTFISSPDGNEKLRTVYNAGNLFGEASFFDRLPRVSSAMALTDCQILKIDRRMVTEAIAGDPEFALSMLNYLARTVRMLSAHVDDMAFLQADGRLARQLLSLAPGPDGWISCTQEELADAVSVSRVTVSRILGRFAKNGWLETGYRAVRLLRRDALEALLPE